jgi:PST family polysaccharide transporter
LTTARTVAKGAAWTIGSSLFSRGLTLVGTLVLIRFVAPSSYGEASAAVVVVGTINQLSTLGVGIYAIATRDATRDDLYHATFIHVVLGLLAFFGALLLAKPLSPMFGAPNMYQYVPLLACSALADRLAFMPERVLIRNLRFKRVSLVRSLGEIVYAVTSVVAAWKGLGGLAIVIGNAARAGIRMLATLISVKRVEWLQIGPIRYSVLRKIGGYGFQTALGHLGYYATLKWDNLLVSRYFGAAVMGGYNLAYSLAEIPATQVAEQITDVMQASYAHMSSEERRRTLLRSFGVIALVTFPLTVGLGAIAPTLADVFLDKKWAGTGALLMTLSFLFVVRPPYAAVSSFITVERGPRPLIIVEWLTVAVLLAGLLTFGRISPLWACGAVGLAFVTRALIGMSVAGAVAKISLPTLLGRLWQPLLACVPLAAAVFGTRLALHRVGLSSRVLELALEVFAGAVAYVGAAFVVAPGAARDVLSVARRSRAAPAPVPPT